jgi:hypothetical protein
VRVLSCRILLILLFFAQSESHLSAGKRDDLNDWEMGLTLGNAAACSAVAIFRD